MSSKSGKPTTKPLKKLGTGLARNYEDGAGNDSATSLDHQLLSFLQNAIDPKFTDEDASHYCTAMTAEGVDLNTLCFLERDDLKTLGIQDYTHRARMLRAVELLRCGKWREGSPKELSGEPVEVYIKFGCHPISQGDSVAGTADVKFFFDMYWYDPRLIGKPEGSLHDHVWRPDVTVLNGASQFVKTILNDPPVLVESATGKVLYAIFFQGTIMEQSDLLRHFPYDENRVRIYCTQGESLPSEYVFRPHQPLEDSVSIQFDYLNGLLDWTLRGYSAVGLEDYGGNGVLYTRYVIDFHLMRKRLYYLYKVAFPILLTTAFCFSGFFFEPSNLTDRNNTALTMFLATSALLYVVGSSLPTTDFLTTLDKFTLWSMITQFVMAILSWACSRLVAKGELDVARALDGAGVVALPTLYCIAIVILFGPYEYKLWRMSANDRPSYLSEDENFIPITEAKFVMPKEPKELISRRKTSIATSTLAGTPLLVGSSCASE